MAPPNQLLTVDDNEAQREIMKRTLGAAFPGAEVRAVADPSTVEKICSDHSFDCVLLDYDMPEMDGLTLARLLRAGDPHLAIILVTGAGDEMLVAEAFRGGVSDYIPKSRVSVESMRRIVDQAIHVASLARVIDQQRDELETFAYALAHDFKQPIRQIITFSKMISDELRGVEASEIPKHLDFLGHAAARLDKLVDVMVQYTLLSQPPELSDVDLNSVFAAIRASLAPLLAERGAEFVAPTLAPSVRGNDTLMIQVLQNLIVNGLNYNRSAVPRVEVTARDDAEGWVLVISDNGIGIAPEYLSEIFKPLIRLHSAKEYPGTGLGLTLARKAVVTQKGEIWCESTPGHGSVFYIRLPGVALAATGKRIAGLPQHGENRSRRRGTPVRKPV